MKYLKDSTRALRRSGMFAGLLCCALLLLGCVNTRVGLGAIASRQTAIRNDVVDAVMQFPSINNRTFDGWAEKNVDRNFQNFREQVILPRLFQLLEEGNSYLYNGDYQVVYDERLNLIGVLFTSQWGDLGALDEGQALTTGIFWLQEQREVKIIDLFIDPRALYRTVSTFARSQLADQFPREVLEQVIQPDRDHIRHILLSSEYLVAFWPTSAFQSQTLGITRVNIPWSALLGDKPIKNVIARAFLPPSLS